MRRILTAGLIAASVIGLAACSDWWGSSGSSRNAPAAESSGYSSGSGTSNPAGSNTGYGSSAPDHNSGPNTQYQVH